MESDIDWSDEGAESTKSTENKSQFEDSSGEEAQENVNSYLKKTKVGLIVILTKTTIPPCSIA